MWFMGSNSSLRTHKPTRDDPINMTAAKENNMLF